MDYYSSLFASKLSGGGGGGGGSAVLINKDISANGTYNASSDNADGYKKVVVNVPNPSTGSINITQNGTYDVTEKASAVVDVPTLTAEPLSVTENGTYTAPAGKAYSPVSVNVSGGVPITDIIERTNFPETVVYEGTHALYSGTFSRVTGLKSFTATENVGIESGVFNGATDLESVSMPLCTANSQSLGDLFRDCTSLSSVNLPKVKLLGQNIFRNCASLKTLVMQSITALRDSFAYNAGLQKVDLPVCSSIAASNHFYNCPLEVLVLRNSSVCGLGNIGTFGNTPFASNGTGGTLYVPSSLISSYQSATNWSTILGYANNQIKAIEGSIYENTYVDGTPIGA